MMYGFLIGYSLAMTAIVAAGVWRSFKGRHQKAETKQPSSLLAKVIEEEFGKRGIAAKVHELPSTPEETIAVYAHAILLALKDSDAVRDAWLRSIRDKADENKRDVAAVMQGTHAIIKTLTEEKKETTPGKTKGQFASYFAYARDNFKLTDPQKRVVDTIIKNLTT